MKLQINESNFQAYTCHSHKVSFLPFISNEKRKCFALIACHFLCIYSKTKAYNIQRMGGTINGRQGTRLDCDIPPPLKRTSEHPIKSTIRIAKNQRNTKDYLWCKSYNWSIAYKFSNTDLWNKLKQSLFFVHNGTLQREHLFLVYVLRPVLERTKLIEQ